VTNHPYRTPMTREEAKQDLYDRDAVIMHDDGPNDGWREDPYGIAYRGDLNLKKLVDEYGWEAIEGKIPQLEYLIRKTMEANIVW
jgi:hypothetical protein